MSTRDQFDDFYKPGQPAVGRPPSPKRPGGLTAICVIAIVLASMGYLSALSSGAGLLLRDQMQQAMSGMGTPNAQMKFQQEMQEQMNAVMDDFLVVNVALVIVHFVIATLLLVGGVQALGLKPSGRRVLVLACGAAIVFEFVRGAVAVLVQLRMLSVMHALAQQLAGGAPMGRSMARLMQFSIFVGLVIAFVWLLAKIVFYSWSALYLRRPRVRELFEPAETGV